jgi:RNA polymerase sigma-70 factor (ECF subfamily)
MQNVARMQTTLSDEELYRLMRAGERDAFAELYRRHEPALYRYALHASGSPSVAEEVAHEVFVQLMSSGVGFNESRGALGSYLYGVARNLVRVARRLGPVLPGPMDDSADQAVSHDIVGDLIHREAVDSLYAALREMPDCYRDVVILCDLEERSYEDAARLLGRPVGTVRSRLHRARALLGAKLKRLRSAAEACSI